EGKRPLKGKLSEAVELLQIDNGHYSLNGDRQEDKLAGWIELHAGKMALGVAGRWSWQQYPQGFALSRNRLVYNLWAPEADLSKVGVGAAKTHEIWFWLAPA